MVLVKLMETGCEWFGQAGNVSGCRKARRRVGHFVLCSQRAINAIVNIVMTLIPERAVLLEFIKMYRDSPCLWDTTSELYRNKVMKHESWIQMTEILQKLDPDANLNTTKKKVDNLRAAFFREVKKVRASERTATDESEIYVPSLWYYRLMSFLNTKERALRASGPRRTSDPLQYDIKPTLTSDEESMESSGDLLVQVEPETPAKRRLFSSSRKVKRNPSNTQTFSEPLEKKRKDHKTTNYFGMYVGDELDQVSSLQRNIAERLISEVLFLAKTDNLNYESRIEPKASKAPSYNVTRKEISVEAQNEKRPRTLLKELLSDRQYK